MLFSTATLAQEKSKETSKDTTVFKQKYGLRLGADFSKLVRTVIDDNYSGFEIMADYRLTQRLYLAGELGNEQRTLDKDNLNATSSGSYFKAGIDYNLYTNWLDMENMIYSGFRVGASTFSQTLNEFNVFDVNNQYFGNPVTITEPRAYNGLSAVWAELIFGVKAEVLNNLYIGLNVQMKFLVTETSPDNFENLYIPGFNRTYDSGIIGAGFGYNISYLIPIFKKNKLVIEEVEKTDGSN
jgi:hypothetical protein